MRCPHCGAELPEGSTFCSRCGNHLTPTEDPYAVARGRYRELQERLRRREIDQATFQREHGQLVVRDSSGQSWLPAPNEGEWYLWDGQSWAVQQVDLGTAEQPAWDEEPRARPARPIRRAKRKHPIRRAIFVTFLLIALLACGAVALKTPLLETIGLRKPLAERVFGQTPNRQAAEAIMGDLEQAGLDTQGVSLYVLPYGDRDASVALGVLDASQGFRFDRTSDEDPVLEYLQSLALGESAQRHGIDRVAVQYRDEKGEAPLIVTASTESIARFARGEITRQELLQAIDAQVDIAALVAEVK